jgi:hypothetical protein
MAKRTAFHAGDRVKIHSPRYPEYSQGKITRFLFPGRITKRIKGKKYLSIISIRKGESDAENRRRFEAGLGTFLLVPVSDVTKVKKKRR